MVANPTPLGPGYHQIFLPCRTSGSVPRLQAEGIELKKLLPLVAEHIGPVYLRISRADMPIIFDESHKVKIGKGIVMRYGKVVTIIANGHMVSRSIEAVASLKSFGIDAGLINIHTVKPLDTTLIKQSATETGAIVTAEEHLLAGGLGSAVSEVLSREIPVPIEMVGISDTFAETALDHDSLLDYYGMSIGDIVKAAQKAIKRKVRD